MLCFEEQIQSVLVDGGELMRGDSVGGGSLQLFSFKQKGVTISYSSA